MYKVLAASIALAAVTLSGCGSSDSGDTLRAADRRQPPAERPEMKSPLNGYITETQRARRGVDGAAYCSGPRVQEYLAGLSQTENPRAQLIGAFLTDFAGLVDWGGELQGGQTLPSSGAPPALTPPELHAICYFRGDFTVNGQVPEEGTTQGQYLVIDVALASGGTASLLGLSPEAIGVFAPAPPSGESLPEAFVLPPTVPAVQPPEVTVADSP